MLRLLFFLVLLTLPLRANLGESVEDCVKRYGTPVGYSEASAKSPFGTVAFSASGYTLLIFVMNDKEVGARVSKTDKTGFSEGETKNILAADSAGGPWISTKSVDPTCDQWSRADLATAIYDKANHVLIFTSDAMKKALNIK